MSTSEASGKPDPVRARCLDMMQRQSGGLPVEPTFKPNSRIVARRDMTTTAELETTILAARRRWIPYCCFTPLAIIRAHMQRHWVSQELKRREVNLRFSMMKLPDNDQNSHALRMKRAEPMRNGGLIKLAR